MHRYFTELQDSRFSAVRVYDHLPASSAVVMERLKQPNLRFLVFKASRFCGARSASELARCFDHVGAWLRAFHSVPMKGHEEVRQGARSDLLNMIRGFAKVLRRQYNDRALWDRVLSVAEPCAREVVPERLPLVVGHGDYAMRNILVDRDYTITVLDTLARWRTSMYEDIGFFLVGLHTNKFQVLSQGLAYNKALMNHYAERFLAGYFGEGTVPAKAVRLYEIQALMDKWSSRLSSGQSGAPQAVLKNKLMNRYFRSYLEDLLTRLARE